MQSLCSPSALLQLTSISQEGAYALVWYLDFSVCCQYTLMECQWAYTCGPTELCIYMHTLKAAA